MKFRLPWKALGTIAAGVVLMGASSSRRRNASIVAPQVQYTPSDEDWLWLAVACSAESGDYRGQLAACWAMISRFAAFEQRTPGQFPTLTSLVRAFSQPVNPIWSDLDACTSDGRGCCGHRCTQADVNRRLRIQARSWSWISENQPSLYRMINLFKEGRPPENPIPGYTNFAACWATGNRGLDVSGNCYFRDPPLQGEVQVR